MAYGDIKQLASITLHTSQSIVYSAPTSKSVEIGTIWVHNNTLLPQGINAFFPFTGSQATGSATASAELRRFSETISGSTTLEVSPKVPFVINSSGTNFADKIVMSSSQTASINVIIYGREQV
jgi:hypothetical protein